MQNEGTRERGRDCNKAQTIFPPVIIRSPRSASVHMSLCLSMTVLALQATKRHQSDTNSSSATSA